MNDLLPADDEAPILDERTLDRLVDGELPAREERRLLARLDQTPDGWRRCALAFLEAQAWRKHLGPIAAQCDLTAAPSKSVGSSRWPSAWLTSKSVRTWGSRLTLAASFLLAFSLGLALRRVDFGPSQLAPRVASSSIAVQQPAPATQVVAKDSPATRTASELKRLRLQLAGLKQPAELQWPMYEPDQLASARAQDDAVDASESLIEALEDQGHQVRRHRDWVPVQLDDGRAGLVPVDRLEIQPVEWNTYQ